MGACCVPVTADMPSQGPRERQGRYPPPRGALPRRQDGCPGPARRLPTLLAPRLRYGRSLRRARSDSGLGVMALLDIISLYIHAFTHSHTSLSLHHLSMPASPLRLSRHSPLFASYPMCTQSRRQQLLPRPPRHCTSSLNQYARPPPPPPLSVRQARNPKPDSHDAIPSPSPPSPRASPARMRQPSNRRGGATRRGQGYETVSPELVAWLLGSQALHTCPPRRRGRAWASRRTGGRRDDWSLGRATEAVDDGWF